VINLERLLYLTAISQRILRTGNRSFQWKFKHTATTTNHRISFHTNRKTGIKKLDFFQNKTTDLYQFMSKFIHK